MKTISGRTALELLERAVQERGEDFVYSKIPNPRAGEDDFLNDALCLYFHGGAPSCIVGLALSYEGATQHDFEPYENMGASCIDEIDGLELTFNARRVFDEAQSKQDAGFTWGDAIDAAREWLATTSEGDLTYA